MLLGHINMLWVLFDEMTNSEYMKVFAGAFQIFVRQELPVFLLGTGLYENIEELQNEKSLTFLYRAPKIQLKPLNNVAIINKYKTIFNISAEQASQMAGLTKGYPFAFQVLGYLKWNEFNPYRKRLIRKGIVSGETRGYVYFTLPLFDEYVVANY